MALRGRGSEVADTPAFLAAARAIGDPQELGPALAAAALVAWAQADAPTAIAYIEELDACTREAPDSSRLQYAPLVLRLCVDLDRLDLAERLLDRPAPGGARQETVAAAGRAVIAEARGDFDEAGELYAEAARLLESYDIPYELGHALLGHWRCTRDDESLRRADEIFRRLGAVVPEAAARAARESTG